MTTKTVSHRERLRDLIEDHDVSPWKLADELGRDHKYFARKMSGDRPTYLTDVYAVEHALECEEV